MGKTVGSIRRTRNVVPGGKDGSIWAMALSTCNVVLIMSSPHPKSSETCADPRLDTERTFNTPGTRRIACSTGMVTSSTIWLEGRSPASRLMTTRGKETAGKRLTGKLKAANTPASARAMVTTIRERRCRSIAVANFIVRFLPLPCLHSQYLRGSGRHSSIHNYQTQRFLLSDQPLRLWHSCRRIPPGYGH